MTQVLAVVALKLHQLDLAEANLWMWALLLVLVMGVLGSLIGMRLRRPSPMESLVQGPSQAAQADASGVPMTQLQDVLKAALQPPVRILTEVKTALERLKAQSEADTGARQRMDTQVDKLGQALTKVEGMVDDMGTALQAVRSKQDMLDGKLTANSNEAKRRFDAVESRQTELEKKVDYQARATQELIKELQAYQATDHKAAQDSLHYLCGAAQETLKQVRAVADASWSDGEFLKEIQQCLEDLKPKQGPWRQPPASSSTGSQAEGPAPTGPPVINLQDQISMPMGGYATVIFPQGHAMPINVAALGRFMSQR